MITNWTEARIREELKRLDEITGLDGAKLPISFSNSIRTLGQYCSANGGAFRFSNYYYQNPEWPDEEALDTIRHEYAHYYDHMVYGNFGHGATWKQCCRIVGAFPIRCYSDRRAEYYQKKHAEEARISSRFDTYCVGDGIEHPKYGYGIIVGIDGESLSRCIVVDFSSVGSKKLSLQWVDSYCKKRLAGIHSC